jgi:hypothetical protein
VESEEELFAVSIKGQGVTIEKTVPVNVARQMINVIMGGAEEPQVSKYNLPEVGSAAAQGGRRISLREFLHESQASSNPEKITVIAEYLREHEGKEEFARDEIKGLFRQAGEGAPANFPRDFSVAVRNGWVAEDTKSPGSFFVTNTGRAAISNKFSGEIKKGGVQPASRKRSRKAKASSSAEKDIE